VCRSSSSFGIPIKIGGPKELLLRLQLQTVSLSKKGEETPPRVSQQRARQIVLMERRSLEKNCSKKVMMVHGENGGECWEQSAVSRNGGIGTGGRGKRKAQRDQKTGGGVGRAEEKTETS
jgi:hypothetical protein